MPHRDPTLLVSTDWLQERLGSPDIRIIDASWHLPNTGRSGRAEFDEAHIPGALFFDIDEIADHEAALPHMLPDPVKFASRVRKLGIGDGTTVVAYDTNNMIASARAWWMFRAMCHTQVAVLDGGFQKWRAEDRPVTDDVSLPFERHFTPRPNWSLVKSYEDVRRGLESRAFQIVDARSATRFAGSEPEPRPGLRAGHMPGAINLPYPSLLNPDGTMKSADDLTALFGAKGLDPRKPIVASCGSGVSACVPLLALASIGQRDAALYDGSWAEWGAREDAPIATGS